MTHYEVLGIKPDASAAQIRGAFRKLAAAHHPDREQGCSVTMSAVNAAYETLSNAEKREHYDRTGTELPLHPIEHQAREYLLSIMDQCIKSKDIINPLQTMHNSIRNDLQLLAHQREMCALALRNIERLKQKISSQGANIFSGLFDQRSVEVQKNLDHLAEQEKMLNKAKEILAFYRCEADAINPHYRPSFMIGDMR